MFLVVLVTLCSLSFGANVVDCMTDCINDYNSQLTKQVGEDKIDINRIKDTKRKCADYCMLKNVSNANPNANPDPAENLIPKQEQVTTSY